MAPPDYLDLRDRNRVFEELAAFSGAGYALAGDADAVFVQGGQTSASLLRVLGVSPLIGRGFADADNEPGAEPVAIASHALWQQRFGGDPAILGRPAAAGGVPAPRGGSLAARRWFATCHLRRVLQSSSGPGRRAGRCTLRIGLY
jgi:hypothetical protein